MMRNLPHRAFYVNGVVSRRSVDSTGGKNGIAPVANCFFAPVLQPVQHIRDYSPNSLAPVALRTGAKESPRGRVDELLPMDL
jgi:hypothetical protein